MRTDRMAIFAAVLLSLALFTTLVRASSDDEISLFDSKGRAIAYIAEDDTIYLWDGKPVAYVDKAGASGRSIFGFNGKHLGWLKAEIIYDHDGNVVGGVKGAFRTATELEPLKGLKELKPLKSLQELPPLSPLFSKEWSAVPLRLFLEDGAD